MHAIAFLDVDETLLAINSMGALLVAHQGARGRSPAQVGALVARLRALDVGGDRGAVSRAYFATFAGVRAADLRAFGERWFAGLAADGFHRGVAREVATARSQGTALVLVSGGPAATVAPVARAVGADAWFATEQEQRDGVLTGASGEALVGEHKARVVRRVLRERGVRAEECVAYGDHASDLAMLEAVGSGVVVGADPVLTAAAARRGWRVLASAACSPRTVSTP